ncbi:hypothetical protein BC829DRAFT_421571 [Chytridium lagenaria]|nr:hypothetical protein BC829DRAFT_421571 [Chytridium lagenaria]
MAAALPPLDPNTTTYDGTLMSAFQYRNLRTVALALGMVPPLPNSLLTLLPNVMAYLSAIDPRPAMDPNTLLVAFGGPNAQNDGGQGNGAHGDGGNAANNINNIDNGNANGDANAANLDNDGNANPHIANPANAIVLHAGPGDNGDEEVRRQLQARIDFLENQHRLTAAQLTVALRTGTTRPPLHPAPSTALDLGQFLVDADRLDDPLLPDISIYVSAWRFFRNEATMFTRHDLGSPAWSSSREALFHHLNQIRQIGVECRCLSPAQIDAWETLSSGNYFRLPDDSFLPFKLEVIALLDVLGWYMPSTNASLITTKVAAVQRRLGETVRMTAHLKTQRRSDHPTPTPPTHDLMIVPSFLLLLRPPPAPLVNLVRNTLAATATAKATSAIPAPNLAKRQALPVTFACVINALLNSFPSTDFLFFTS